MEEKASLGGKTPASISFGARGVGDSMEFVRISESRIVNTEHIVSIWRGKNGRCRIDLLDGSRYVVEESFRKGFLRD